MMIARWCGSSGICRKMGHMAGVTQMARTRRGFGLTATTLAIALFGLVMATTASAALPIALATGPAVLARSVSTDTETITFAGVVNDGGEPLLYGAWGLLDDATGATLFESLVPDGVFSVDLTVTATAAGSSYTFIVAALNATGFSLDYKTVVVKGRRRVRSGGFRLHRR